MTEAFPEGSFLDSIEVKVRLAIEDLVLSNITTGL